MKLKKFQQSGFIFQTNSGFKFALDIGNKTPLEELVNENVDVFMVSHIHGDHFSLEHINALQPEIVFLNKECHNQIIDKDLGFKIEKIKTNQDFVLNNQIKVQVFSVDHGPNVSSPVLENFGFVFEIDNQKIYFAGDIFYDSGINVSNLEVDYALIPIGGFYTFGPVEALNFIRKFRRIGKVIPIHYEKTPETLDQFKELIKNEFDLS